MIAAIYCTLAVSLQLIAGEAGLLSVMHAAIFGVGAYATAIALQIAGLSTLLALCVGVVAGGILAVTVAVLALRVPEESFVLMTFAVQVIVADLAINLTATTGGAAGIRGIPHPRFFRWDVNTQYEFLTVFMILLVLTVWINQTVSHRDLGRTVRAAREDPLLASAVGRNPTAARSVVLLLGSLPAATLGGLYAMYMTTISPEPFAVMDSVLILSMVIVGGAGSAGGALAGAILYVLLQEVLRFIPISSGSVANVRQLLYGLALVAIVVYRPRGMLGRYDFTAG